MHRAPTSAFEDSPEQLLIHDESSTFAFSCELRWDRAGLVVEYPGIATRQG